MPFKAALLSLWASVHDGLGDKYRAIRCLKRAERLLDPRSDNVQTRVNYYLGNSDDSDYYSDVTSASSDSTDNLSDEDTDPIEGDIIVDAKLEEANKEAITTHIPNNITQVRTQPNPNRTGRTLKAADNKNIQQLDAIKSPSKICPQLPAKKKIENLNEKKVPFGSGISAIISPLTSPRLPVAPSSKNETSKALSLKTKKVVIKKKQTPLSVVASSPVNEDDSLISAPDLLNCLEIPPPIMTSATCIPALSEKERKQSTWSTDYALAVNAGTIIDVDKFLCSMQRNSDHELGMGKNQDAVERLAFVVEQLIFEDKAAFNSILNCNCDLSSKTFSLKIKTFIEKNKGKICWGVPACITSLGEALMAQKRISTALSYLLIADEILDAYLSDKLADSETSHSSLDHKSEISFQRVNIWRRCALALEILSDYLGAAEQWKAIAALCEDELLTYVANQSKIESLQDFGLENGNEIRILDWAEVHDESILGQARCLILAGEGEKAQRLLVDRVGGDIGDSAMNTMGDLLQAQSDYDGKQTTGKNIDHLDLKEKDDAGNEKLSKLVPAP